MAKCQWPYDRESGTKALHLVSAGKRASARFKAKVQDKSNEITAIPALLELLDLAGCIVTLDAMGTQKVLLIRFIPQVQIIFSVLNQIIPRCFNRWNSGFSKWADGSTHPREHTTESGHHRIDTRTVWTLGGPVCPLSSSRRGQDCKVLSSWNGLVGYGTKPPTKCSSTQQFAAA